MSSPIVFNDPVIRPREFASGGTGGLQNLAAVMELRGAVELAEEVVGSFNNSLAFENTQIIGNRAQPFNSTNSNPGPNDGRNEDLNGQPFGCEQGLIYYKDYSINRVNHGEQTIVVREFDLEGVEIESTTNFTSTTIAPFETRSEFFNVSEDRWETSSEVGNNSTGVPSRFTVVPFSFGNIPQTEWVVAEDSRAGVSYNVDSYIFRDDNDVTVFTGSARRGLMLDRREVDTLQEASLSFDESYSNVFGYNDYLVDARDPITENGEFNSLVSESYRWGEWFDPTSYYMKATGRLVLDIVVTRSATGVPFEEFDAGDVTGFIRNTTVDLGTYSRYRAEVVSNDREVDDFTHENVITNGYAGRSGEYSSVQELIQGEPWRALTIGGVAGVFNSVFTQKSNEGAGLELRIDNLLSLPIRISYEVDYNSGGAGEVVSNQVIDPLSSMLDSLQGAGGVFISFEAVEVGEVVGEVLVWRVITANEFECFVVGSFRDLSFTETGFEGRTATRSRETRDLQVLDYDCEGMRSLSRSELSVESRYTDFGVDVFGLQSYNTIEVVTNGYEGSQSSGEVTSDVLGFAQISDRILGNAVSTGWSSEVQEVSSGIMLSADAVDNKIVNIGLVGVSFTYKGMKLGMVAPES